MSDTTDPAEDTSDLVEPHEHDPDLEDVYDDFIDTVLGRDDPAAIDDSGDD